MKVKLLKKLRKEAKKKVKLYQMDKTVYKVTSPYYYISDSYYHTLEEAICHTIQNRRDYILTKIARIRKEKEQKYPILINI